LKSLKKIFPKEKKTFIVGFKFDKDIKRMLKEIINVADKIIVTQFNMKTDMVTHASAKAEDIRKEIIKAKYEGEVIIEKDLRKALKLGSKKGELAIVTGSLYLVGESRNKIALF
jgi:folylpolyglutamate synthase/dihydropteroate synthase